MYTDSQTFEIISKELKRQQDVLELIPSENYVSKSVLEAIGSVFTNKYSEGYPNRRYYGGNNYTDELETLAIERAKKLFHADHANVQALSGAPANTAAFFAYCDPGDTIMTMDLSHGGHLTHGHPVTHLAKLFRFVRYKIKNLETGELDYENLRQMALTEHPKIILAGFTSYPRNYDFSKIKAIADEVGAVAMADMAHIAGLIASGVMENPMDYDFQLMTTTTHKTLRGPRGALILTKGVVGNPLKEVERKIENMPTLVDRSVFPGLQGGPHMNTIAGIAVALKEASTPDFKEYSLQILKNAQTLSRSLIELGCTLITGGTDNHLMVINTVKSFGLTGTEVQKLLDAVDISTNKNVIPDDPLPPYNPSGLRIGTPAVTTRGLKEAEMKLIAKLIVSAVKYKGDTSELEKIKNQVKEITSNFPLDY